MNLKEKEIKLNLLNNKFIKEEKRVLKSIKKVIQLADNFLNNGEIGDYYFDLEVQGFKSK